MSSTANLIVSSNETGSGIGSKKYWDEFAGGNITKFVGVYSIRVNETDLNLTGEFTVGLTDKPKYRRDEVVSVRGSSYQPNENVTIDITFGGLSVSGYPKNVTADTGGVVNDTWLIPTIAEPGTYTVTLTNATTPGTVKDPADTKNFTITGFIVQIETRNLDNETVAGLTVYAWNATKPTTLEEMPPVASGRTNETGWVRFPLEAGNYTFWALWRHENTEEGQEAMVGSLDNQSVMEDRVLTLPCRLAHIKIAVKDEADIPLPLVDVTLACNYTAWFGTSFEPPPISRETNLDGVTTVSNMPTNISYTIEARRFNNPFNRTLIENLTASLWVNITCPTYTLFIHVIDANENPAQNVRVNVSEWSTWLPQGSKTTDQSGSVDFFITFGKYKVSVSNYSVELKRVVVINETIIDLTEEKQWMLIYCKLLNLDLTVKVVDYFGHPIPNALVKIKRENVEMKDLTTGSSGTATLEGIIGGEYQVSVYIRGKLCGTMSQSVDASKEMVCKIDGCVVIGGYPMETSQFITLVLLSLLVGAFGLTLLRRKLPRMMKKEKTPSKKGG
jgi:protocatechuate 3,4-dioxygenase beta subunit